MNSTMAPNEKELSTDCNNNNQPIGTHQILASPGKDYVIFKSKNSPQTKSRRKPTYKHKRFIIYKHRNSSDEDDDPLDNNLLRFTRKYDLQLQKERGTVSDSSSSSSLSPRSRSSESADSLKQSSSPEEIVAKHRDFYRRAIPIVRKSAFMHRTSRLALKELNKHLICVLCGGYFIDATTFAECLHTFCRSCIVSHLEASHYCPVCDVLVHKTRPQLSLRPDQQLQDLVYKLVPGLFSREMKQRKEFYTQNPDAVTECDTELEDQRVIFNEDENISICLEFSPDGKPQTNAAASDNEVEETRKRYLLCPAAFSVAQIKKFVRTKFELAERYEVDIFHTDEPLNELYTLMDIAYIYTWQRWAPLHLYYCIFEQKITSNVKRKLEQSASTTTSTKNPPFRSSSPFPAQKKLSDCPTARVKPQPQRSPAFQSSPQKSDCHKIRKFSANVYHGYQHFRKATDQHSNERDATSPSNNSQFEFDPRQQYKVKHTNGTKTVIKRVNSENGRSGGISKRTIATLTKNKPGRAFLKSHKLPSVQRNTAATFFGKK